MADRGSNIQEMLASKGVKVNVPPFMNQSGQFTEQEILATRRIATLRIHVERAIECIPYFRLYSNNSMQEWSNRHDFLCVCNAH